MATSKMEHAPGELELVRAFVNTTDLQDGPEQLRSPSDLGAWLKEHGLLDYEASVSAPDLRRAIDVRESLRALMVANAGDPLDPDAAPTLDAAARRAKLALRFDRGGGASVSPAAGGVDGALGRLLATASASMADGSWTRLKACRRERCRWAFFDHTKNRSGAWCDMSSCGNREKSEAYRRRHAGDR